MSKKIETKKYQQKNESEKVSQTNEEDSEEISEFSFELAITKTSDIDHEDESSLSSEPLIFSSTTKASPTQFLNYAMTKINDSDKAFCAYFLKCYTWIVKNNDVLRDLVYSDEEQTLQFMKSMIDLEMYAQDYYHNFAIRLLKPSLLTSLLADEDTVLGLPGIGFSLSYYSLAAIDERLEERDLDYDSKDILERTSESCLATSLARVKVKLISLPDLLPMFPSQFITKYLQVMQIKEEKTRILEITAILKDLKQRNITFETKKIFSKLKSLYRKRKSDPRFDEKRLLKLFSSLRASPDTIATSQFLSHVAEDLDIDFHNVKKINKKLKEEYLQISKCETLRSLTQKFVGRDSILLQISSFPNSLDYKKQTYSQSKLSTIIMKKLLGRGKNVYVYFRVQDFECSSVLDIGVLQEFIIDPVKGMYLVEVSLRSNNKDLPPLFSETYQSTLVEKIFSVQRKIFDLHLSPLKEMRYDQLLKYVGDHLRYSPITVRKVLKKKKAERFDDEDVNQILLEFENERLVDRSEEDSQQDAYSSEEEEELEVHHNEPELEEDQNSKNDDQLDANDQHQRENVQTGQNADAINEQNNIGEWN